MGLSMRTASAAAGVTEDVALRYYRNRESLFAAAMRLPVDPVSAIPALMAPGIEGMGERLVRFTLETLSDPAARDDLMSLARTGVSAGQAVTGLQEFIEIGVMDRVAGMIGVPDARMRSALITSYLLGVATMRYGVRLEPLASASDEEVIRMVAPVIQDLLDPRRPIPGSTRARARSAARSPGSGQAPSASQQARKFDPDPAATRAAEAARLAARRPLRRPRPRARRRRRRPRPRQRPGPRRPGWRPRRLRPVPPRPGRRLRAGIDARPLPAGCHEDAAAEEDPPRRRREEDARPRRRPPKKTPAKKTPAKKAPTRKTPHQEDARHHGDVIAPPPGPQARSGVAHTVTRRTGGRQRPSNSRATAMVVAWSTRPSCHATVTASTALST